MLRKNFYFIVVLLIFLFSCKQSTDNESFSNVNKKVVLQSSNGFTIAKNYNDLKEKIKPYIIERFGKDVDFVIDNVMYLESKKEVAAIIFYTTNKNISSNIIQKYSLNTIDEAGGGSGSVTTVWCEGTCSDGSGCITSGTIKPDGSVTFKCSCSPCKLKIKQETR